MSVYQQVAERFLHGTDEGPSEAAPTLTDVLLAISKAQDLLKGQPLRSTMKVSVIAGSVAKLMGLSSRETAAVVYAGLIYDLGLVRIASDIYGNLPRQSHATGGEKELFRQHALINARVIGNPHDDETGKSVIHQLLTHHPQAAASYIDSLHLSGDIKTIVECHHELCDGSGYPFGLTKDTIPIGAAILAFADTVEGVMAEVSGLTSRRHALESFLDIKVSGRFHPEVVSAFRGLVEDNDEFLKRIAGLEVADMAKQLVPERQTPLSGDMLLDMMRVLGRLADDMTPLYTKGHADRSAGVAAGIANRLGISPPQCGELVIAALTHDVGRLALPIQLLLKSGPLNDAEWETVRDHPRHTEEVLRDLPGFANIVLWASEHHERMNGRGYPGNKKGFEISVGGRIIAIADAFTALTSPRPYRTHAHELMDALPVLGQGRFTQFDNQLVSILRQAVMQSEVIAR